MNDELWTCEFWEATTVENASKALESVTDINIRNPNSQEETLLHTAVQTNTSKEVVELLLDRGADIEAYDKYNRTVLYEAAESSTPEVVALLLDRGANVNGSAQRIDTPLHIAAVFNKPEVVALLLDRGADIEARSADGETPMNNATPLQYVLIHGRPEMVEFLRNRGAKDPRS